MSLSWLFLGWLLLWSVAGVCHSSCKECNNPDTPTMDTACTECYPEHFLYMSWCYMCKDCHFFDQCETQCGIKPQEPAAISQNDLIAIITSVIVGTIVIVVVVICICRRRNSETTTDKTNSLPSDSRLVVIDPAAFEWQLSKKKISQSENCAICLDGGVFLETICHHYYHARCLQQWALKAGDCPLCKSKIISPAKFYCQNCFQNFVEVDMRDVGGVINGQHWNKCQVCQNSI